jgi:hypothetical protein
LKLFKALLNVDFGKTRPVGPRGISSIFKPACAIASRMAMLDSHLSDPATRRLKGISGKGAYGAQNVAAAKALALLMLKIKPKTRVELARRLLLVL